MIKEINDKRRKEMSDIVTSLIRTYVPSAVGALLAWLLTLGVQVDAETQLGLVTALTGLLIALYYTLIRLLEKKYPKIGVLLGSAKKPTY